MTVNTLKGEVSFQALGETFTLAYPIDTLIVIEAHYDRPFTELAADLLSDRLRFVDVRKLFGFGLIAKRPMDEESAFALAGQIVGELGVQEAGYKMGLSLLHLFAKAEPGAAGAGPRKRGGAGTGKPASASGSSSASETPTPSDD